MARFRLLFLVIASRAAQEEGDDDYYLSILELFRKHHKDDPATDLMLIDYYFLRGKLDKAAELLDRLNRYVGGDPYLLVLKGGFLVESKRYADARAAVEKALAEEPTLKSAYPVRINIALIENNHDDALTWLKKGAESGLFEADPELMKEIPEFARFVKSPQFRDYTKWLEKREE